MAMNDYQSLVNLDDEPMYMRVFLAFHNQIIKSENEHKKKQKNEMKAVLV
jgi:hypothetical protein